MSKITDPAELRRRHDDFLRQQVEHIGQYGQSVIGVFGDEHHPSFTYTVGMAVDDLPEFIIFSIVPTIAQPILNDLCDRARKEPLAPGFYDDVFAGFTMCLLACDDRANDYVVQAINLLGPLTVLQVIYPDSNNRFDWELDGDIEPTQPLLGVLPPWAFTRERS